LG
ncbi:putative RNA and SrmB- binding site of polymerase A family protein, partial [Chlamydia psittaci 84-8471/1]|jgi:hypothetical protein